MIDLACIFTTGGVVLFYKAFCTLKFDAIDLLVKKILVQDKAAETSSFMEPYMVKWKVANDLELVFALVYQEIFHLQYIDDLLEMMRNEYREKFYPQIVIEKNFFKQIPAFDKEFVELIGKWEAKQQKNQKKDKIMRSFQDTAKGKQLLEKDDKAGSGKKKGKKNDDKEEEKGSSEEDHLDVSTASPSQKDEETKESIEDKKKAALEKLKSKSSKGLDGKRSQTMVPAAPASGSGDKKLEKQKTTWGTNTKVTSSTMKELDFSSATGEKDDVELAKKLYLGDEPDPLAGKFKDDDYESSDSDEDEDPKANQNQKKGLLYKLKNSIQNVTGNMVLSQEELDPIMAKFKEGLMEKNVAEEIAQQICDSLKAKLIDTKTKAFTTIAKTVKEAMTESLTKILTPKRNIDIITEAMRAKEKGRPYVLVFIGVNGVGKSTNLAKVAHLLKTKGNFSVMLAACDNFRAGAVEQIKTHGRCLDVPVYEKGYKNDPAIIASEAIREAVQRKMDCVLIDTAGRMQDNEPLMKALARLVALNQPDLVIFVGEALVGNDAVDQLRKFNKSLVDLSPPDRIREIDGILLTKFDTVDDKMGAAVSMTYATGKPVLFVGTGQKYTHMRKLNVKTVVHTMLH